MSLTRSVAAAALAAFNAADDFIKRGELVASGSADYDPVTETYTNSSSKINVRMLRTSVTEKEIEASVANPADTKFVVLGADLVGADPNTQDKIIYETITYNIQKLQIVPGGSVLIFFARRA